MGGTNDILRVNSYLKVSIKMSVDVFGNPLKRAASSTRGPPDIGFKVTSEGNYDIDRKRLLTFRTLKNSFFIKLCRLRVTKLITIILQCALLKNQ